ncbi:telomerase Cajal body protein 1-like isoform X1 [Biomphalaria pfeifferi]|uniref:WD repeat-containing protein 79 n=1 Tax=Biomphalaria pfeifferi TaxID=112525 RepID=A0AAD8FCV4_BIOPF|nr:telomerase Cajal body protein 1-like isoform X1 [Biomphalaria pfeifferi]
MNLDCNNTKTGTSVLSAVADYDFDGQSQNHENLITNTKPNFLHEKKTCSNNSDSLCLNMDSELYSDETVSSPTVVNKSPKLPTDHVLSHQMNNQTSFSEHSVSQLMDAQEPVDMPSTHYLDTDQRMNIVHQNIDINHEVSLLAPSEVDLKAKIDVVCFSNVQQNNINTTVTQPDEIFQPQNGSDMEMWESEPYNMNYFTQVHDKYKLTIDSVPTFYMSAYQEFQSKSEDNFLRGCKWSPDGSCIMTNSNDNCIRMFKPLATQDDKAGNNDLTSNVKIQESGQIYDFAWFPGMTLFQPELCRVVTTCSGIPIHMWDSETGKIVANYRAYDQYDEVTAAYSLSFSCDGSKIYAGYNKAIRIFDTEYPVKSCKLVKTTNTKTKDGQTGIISCFAHSPDGSGLYVAGSYSRHVGIYDSSCDKLVCLIQGQQGGVTHVLFSPDGTKIYSGGRKDAEILCWDTRNLGHILFSALRDVKTNQRMYFDVSQSGQFLMSGNNDGTVMFWNTLHECQEFNGDMFLKPCSQFYAHFDCVNGISFNHQNHMIATASGQRHFQNFDETDSEEETGKLSVVKKKNPWDFSLKLWKIPFEEEVESSSSNRKRQNCTEIKMHASLHL